MAPSALLASAVSTAAATPLTEAPIRSPTPLTVVAVIACSRDHSRVAPSTVTVHGGGATGTPRAVPTDVRVRTYAVMPASSRTTTDTVTVSRPRRVSCIGTPRSRPRRSVVGVQRRVEPSPRARPRHRLDGPGDAVAPVEHPGLPTEVPSLHDRAVGQRDLGAGRDVAPCFDNAPVAQRDPDSGVRSEQAALADGDHGRSAARERADDRCAAADVGAVANDDSRADAPFDHRRAERPGVVVDEALVHHRRTCGEVRPEAHP